MCVSTLVSCAVSNKLKKEQLKQGRRGFSRRNFIALGSMSAVGVWASSSDQMGARVVRGVVAEAARNILKPGYTPTPSTWNSNAVTASWLGHSTVLLNFYGLNILTDPVLGKRIGADTFLGNIGPKRLVAPALKVSQLPKIDLVLLSHAHMDHLDPVTLRDLPGKPHIVAAHDTLDLTDEVHASSRTTLRWNERSTITTEKGDVEIKAFEVNHWGARWKVDTHRGYNGYVLNRGGKKLIFGGDTAWTESFRSLKNEGPYELAIMPIGAYQPWINAHCTPEQAVRMSNDAGARHFLPVHFKTFPFGREGTSEPLTRLQAAIDPQRIGWREVGQTFSC